MLETASLASGSSGNSYFVKNEEGVFIFDLGINVKRLKENLEEFGISISDVKAIFISHEHSDHISGLKTFVKYYPDIPIFISLKTYRVIKDSMPAESFVFFDSNSTLKFKCFEVELPLKLHDAVEPVFFKVKTDDGIVSIITDFGFPNKEIIKAISESKVLFLESNYDERMLEEGRYPESLKQRIRSHTGHFSNCDSGRLLNLHVSEKLNYLILSHISENSNTYELAFKTVSKIIGKRGFKIITATQKKPASLIKIS